MKKFIFALGLVLLPGFALADDGQIRASILQQLLSTFVVEVNSLDKIRTLASGADNPSQFDALTGMVAQQLSETTAQLAVLLNTQSVVNTTVQSQVPTTSTTASAVPVVPPPTCTVSADQVYPSQGGQQVMINWTTQNATSGTLQNHNINIGKYGASGKEKTLSLTPLQAGRANISPLPYSVTVPTTTFEVDVIGDGGTGSCTVDVGLQNVTY